MQHRVGDAGETTKRGGLVEISAYLPHTLFAQGRIDAAYQRDDLPAACQGGQRAADDITATDDQ